jgi:hypothetical protein
MSLCTSGLVGNAEGLQGADAVHGDSRIPSLDSPPVGGDSMKANLPVLVMLGFLLPAAAGSSENPSSVAFARARPHLRLVWFDPSSAAPLAYSGVGGEVRSILGAAGVDVVWQKGAADPLAPGEIAVILLDAEPGRVAMRPDVMGCVIKGDRPSVLWVNLTTVARMLGLDASSRIAWSGRERQQVATALGRVVAHEIVHVIAPQLPHATEGLLSATLDRHHLVYQRLRLDGDSADGFLRSIRLRDTARPDHEPAVVLSRSMVPVAAPFSP